MNRVGRLMRKLNFCSGFVQAQKFSSNKALNSWDLMSAVCLERYPVITKQYTPLESKFACFLEHLDVEHSLKSDHELRLEEDYLRSEKFKRGELDDAEVEQSATVQTAQDFEDASYEELQKFVFGQRETNEDVHKAKNSVHRALHRYLILIVKQCIGKTEPWTLPLGFRLPDESMREVAERILKTLCGDKLKVKLLGNAPIAFYKYKYPPEVQKERNSLGAKVFIFRARYLGGDVCPGDDVSSYLWLTSDELKDFLRPSDCKVIQNVLLENSSISF